MELMNSLTRNDQPTIQLQSQLPYQFNQQCIQDSIQVGEQISFTINQNIQLFKLLQKNSGDEDTLPFNQQRIEQSNQLKSTINNPIQKKQNIQSSQIEDIEESKHHDHEQSDDLSSVSQYLSSSNSRQNQKGQQNNQQEQSVSKTKKHEESLIQKGSQNNAIFQYNQVNNENKNNSSYKNYYLLQQVNCSNNSEIQYLDRFNVSQVSEVAGSNRNLFKSIQSSQAHSSIPTTQDYQNQMRSGQIPSNQSTREYPQSQQNQYEMHRNQNAFADMLIFSYKNKNYLQVQRQNLMAAQLSEDFIKKISDIQMLQFQFQQIQNGMSIIKRPQNLINYGYDVYKDQAYRDIYNDLHNNEKYKYIIDINGGNQSFIRSCMIGYLIQIFLISNDIKDIEKKFLELHDITCDIISVDQNTLNYLKRQNIDYLLNPVEYKNYFLKSFVYIFGVWFTDMQPIQKTGDLILEMIFTDPLFDFSLICFGYSMCNKQLRLTENSNLLIKKYDEFIYDEQRKAISEALKFKITVIYITKMANTNTKKPQLSKFKAEIYPDNPPTIKYPEIKLLNTEMFEKLVLDDKWYQKFQQQQQQHNEKLIECCQCIKKLENENEENHAIKDLKSGLTFYFCIGHLNDIVQNLKLSHGNNDEIYEFQSSVSQKLIQIKIKKEVTQNTWRSCKSNYQQKLNNCCICKTPNKELLFVFPQRISYLDYKICLNCCGKLIADNINKEVFTIETIRKQPIIIGMKNLIAKFNEQDILITQHCFDCKSRNNLSIQNNLNYKKYQNLSLRLCSKCNQKPTISYTELNITFQ